jgi:glycerophosphoryl diester phosphodiesterase
MSAVALQLPSRINPPIGFAHRGGKAHAPENTLEAFQLARKLGASGLETDVFLTADGHVALDHDGVVRHRLRQKPFSEVLRVDLPDGVITLDELYADLGTDFELSIDIKDPAAAEATIRIASAHGAAHRLWACGPDWEVVGIWRRFSAEVKLVDSTRKHHIKGGLERRAAQLTAAKIDAINMHHSDWSGGHTTMFHRFGLATLAWDAQREHELDEMMRIGIDGVFSDHVTRMTDALERHNRRVAPKPT